MIRVLIFGVNSLPHALDTFARGLYIYPIMTTNPKPLAMSLPYVGVEHRRCAQCDGEGVDPETVERWVDADGCLDGGGEECGECHGTGDATCASCGEPSSALSSHLLCAECSTVDALEDAVLHYFHLSQKLGGLPMALKTETARIAESSREWALYRAHLEALIEERARRAPAVNELPF